jgi:ABC-type amino acid transport substrate-binding protein
VSQWNQGGHDLRNSGRRVRPTLNMNPITRLLTSNPGSFWRRQRFSAGVLLLSASLGWLTGCASSPATSPAAPADPKVLRVGVTPTMAPMIFKQGGEYAGIEADLARKLAARLGKQVQFIETPWEKQLEALLEGRTDIIMSSLSVTPARAMRAEFTQPYMVSGQAALVRSSEALAMQIGLFTGDCRAGAQAATTGDYFVQQELPRAKRITYPNAEAGARALLDKRIDAFIHDVPVVWWLASVNEAKGLTVMQVLLTKENLAWAVRKDNTELLDAANQFLTQARQNGELQAVIKRWLPQWR